MLTDGVAETTIVRVAEVAGEVLELGGEVPADPPRAVAVADVQEGELRDARSDVRADDSDPYESPVRKLGIDL